MSKEKEERHGVRCVTLGVYGGLCRAELHATRARVTGKGGLGAEGRRGVTRVVSTKRGPVCRSNAMVLPGEDIHEVGTFAGSY